MKKMMLRFLVFAMLFISLQGVEVKAETFTSASVGYSTYVHEDGWGSEAYGGGLSGSELGKSVQSIRVFLMDEPSGAKILYRTYQVQGGWQSWIENGADSNVPSDLTGIQLKLESYPNAVVHYQVLVQNKGWSNWKQNGLTAGNLTDKIQAIRIKVFEVGVSYQTKNTSNWLSLRHNGETIGDEGESIQALKISLESAPTGAKVMYRTHNTLGNWTSWANNGAIVGNGTFNGLEVKLEGLPSFSVAYQVFIQNIGWSDWIYDGVTAGYLNQDLRIEALRIKIVKTKILPKEHEVEEENDFIFDDEEGNGCYNNYLGEDETVVIGVFKAGITNFNFRLESDIDVDLELYEGDIYGDNPIILNGSGESYFDLNEGDQIDEWYPSVEPYLFVIYLRSYEENNPNGSEQIIIVGTSRYPILLAAHNNDLGTDIKVCYEFGYIMP
jgi:uncharacterized protein YjdB